MTRTLDTADRAGVEIAEPNNPGAVPADRQNPELVVTDVGFVKLAASVVGRYKTDRTRCRIVLTVQGCDTYDESQKVILIVRACDAEFVQIGDIHEIPLFDRIEMLETREAARRDTIDDLPPERPKPDDTLDMFVALGRGELHLQNHLNRADLDYGVLTVESYNSAALAIDALAREGLLDAEDWEMARYRLCHKILTHICERNPKRYITFRLENSTAKHAPAPEPTETAT